MYYEAKNDENNLGVMMTLLFYFYCPVLYDDYVLHKTLY